LGIVERDANAMDVKGGEDARGGLGEIGDGEADCVAERRVRTMVGSVESDW
jgi:hypothetical protein